MIDVCNRHAWAEATAPGSASNSWGCVSTKDRVGDDPSTAMMLLPALILRFLVIAQLYLNLDFSSFFGLSLFLLSVADLTGG